MVNQRTSATPRVFAPDLQRQFRSYITLGKLRDARSVLAEIDNKPASSPGEERDKSYALADGHSRLTTEVFAHLERYELLGTPGEIRRKLAAGEYFAEHGLELVRPNNL